MYLQNNVSTKAITNNPIMYKSLYLKPSEYFITNEKYQIITVLGSCVSTFIWDPITKFTAVNHFMLPICKDNYNPTPKYGDISMDLLIRKLVYKGVNINNLRAKVIGGASTLQHSTEGNYKVGEKNLDFAIKFLGSLDIPIVGLNIGGNFGRRVIFNTYNFDVMVKQIKGINYDAFMKSFEL